MERTTDAMTTERKQGTIGILVGGGPAPGINSVIGATAIQSIVNSQTVLGIRDGFRWIMEGDTSHVKPLSIGEVSRIHFHGGSYLGTSRANPTKHPECLEKTLKTLQTLRLRGSLRSRGRYGIFGIEAPTDGGREAADCARTEDHRQ